MTVDRLCRVNEAMARERLCVWRVPHSRDETLARDLNRHDRACCAEGIVAPLRCADRVLGRGAKRAIRWVGVIADQKPYSCMIGHRFAGSRTSCSGLCGKIPAGPIPLGKSRGTVFLARCLIESAFADKSAIAVLLRLVLPAEERDMSRSISRRVMCGFPHVLCGKRQRRQAA